MFARLAGTIEDIHDTHVVIDVHGVGYLVACSSRTRGQLNVGEAARLIIDTVVREDAINLYGFIDETEQSWFRLLTSVQGVGPRVGLSILSACAPHELGAAIAVADKAVLNRADGVGPKLATRIVTELKDKLPETLVISGAPKGVDKKSGVALMPPAVGAGDEPVGRGPEIDAISALVNLGYGRAEAFAAVMRAKSNGGSSSVAQMIKLSLAELTRGSAA